MQQLPGSGNFWGLKRWPANPPTFTSDSAGATKRSGLLHPGQGDHQVQSRRGFVAVPAVMLVDDPLLSPI
jgi:hypothetical protein